MRFTKRDIEGTVEKIVKSKETKQNKDFSPMVQVFLSVAVREALRDREQISFSEMADLLDHCSALMVVKCADKDDIKDKKAWETFLKQDYSFQEFIRLHAFVYLASKDKVLQKVKKALVW